LAGTVRKVLVKAGETVEAKTQAFVLDAMKMDTYIYAPHAGTVQEVCVQVGDTVQVGMVLARYRSEG
jgi:pyruvate carboxylase